MASTASWSAGRPCSFKTRSMNTFMLALIAGKIACEALCRVLSRSKSQSGVVFGTMKQGRDEVKKQNATVGRLIIVIFAWLLCLYLPAANSAQPAQPDAGSAQHGALFKIQDAHHTIYLFGTIHVGAENFYPLAPRVMQALEQAPAIALEIDPHNIQAMQAAVLQYGFYPEGRSYLTELSPPLQRQVQAALKKYRI